MATPTITVEATLTSILAKVPVTSAAITGWLRITLCGYGPMKPVIPGICHLADAGVPQYVQQKSDGSPTDVLLWGNDLIDPPGTFYEIAILDANKDVVQANNYRFAGSGTFTLSSQAPIVPPYGFPIGDLSYQPCTGGGSLFTAPAPILAVSYNGILIPEGPTLPSVNSWTRGPGNTINLNFTPDVVERIDAFVVF